MRKLISTLIVLSCVVTINSAMIFTVYGVETAPPVTGETFIDPNAAASGAAQGSYASDGGAEGTQPPATETQVVTVTDEDGNPVTDADGNPVTEIITVEVTEGTTPPEEDNSTEMVGAFETRELSPEDYSALSKIKRELEDEKNNRFNDVFGLISAVAGIIIIIYTLILAIAWLVDRIGLSGEVDLVRLLTLNNAITLRDEADKEMIMSGNSGIKILDRQGIIIYTILGCGLGTLLTQSTKLLALVELLYVTITER